MTMNQPEMVHMPDEIVEYIFSWIDPADSATCAAVCRTGAVARKAATRLRYHTTGVTRRKLSSREHIRKLGLLTRTLLENSRLASYVKRYQHFYKAADPFAGEEKNRLGAILTSKGVRHPPWVLQAGNDHHHGHLRHLAYAKTILSLCPNVRSLELCGDIQASLSWDDIRKELEEFSWCTTQPTTFVGSLECLKEVALVDSMDLETFSSNLDSLDPVLFLPKLERLTIDGLNARCFGIRGARRTALKMSTRLRELVLTNCEATPREVVELLTAWPDLRKLVIEWNVRRKEQSASWWNEVYPGLTTCTKLATVEFNGCTASFSLKFLPCLPFLRHLTITKSRLAEERETLGRLLLDGKCLLG
jgi:hypothetical protein